ncbi:MAG: hypothetical protein D3920_15985 [Candidatus Electrothrix sp. AW2]|jgi:hypothetical protein|nr:hypothetical protein [Candidatus Electrothrix gigas]MCI5179383.1 hypothetical protein [Candidatus Electrothrix gigas]MCI5189836.1 hypothetical protein [Candidatus Electrothrix gigas]MCI5192133.1 hypothetical protein [Candidatus Electrothrix gigas]
MNEYRQAHSVALYDAGVSITNLTAQQHEEGRGYPLATGMPPGSFRIPESELSILKSEFRSKQVAMPMGRRQGGSLSFHKTLVSYNETLDEEVRVKDLLIRVDGPQLLSLQLVEEKRTAKGKHITTKEITYCGLFAIEWVS